MFKLLLVPNTFHWPIAILKYLFCLLFMNDNPKVNLNFPSCLSILNGHSRKSKDVINDFRVKISFRNSHRLGKIHHRT